MYVKKKEEGSAGFLCNVHSRDTRYIFVAVAVLWELVTRLD
jgi:hypothetical protein